MKPDDKVRAGIVGVKKRRGRRNALTEAAAAALPTFPANMRDAVDAARERHKARPAAVGTRVYADPKAPEGWFLDSPYRELDAWEVMICESFGTRSHSVMWTFLNQLVGLCEQTWRPEKKGDAGGRWMPDELQLNFIINLLNSEKPDTPLQAAILAQMAANHMMQMRLGEGTLGNSGWIDPARVMASAKLANAFANQADAYLKLRGRVTKQELTISYERHVHVHHHKHAHLHQTPPVEGEQDFSERPHDLTGPDNTVRKTSGSHEGGAALLSENTPGFVVPMPGHAGQAQVLPPRRSKSRRSPG
jgi:hypothetical protein